MAKKVETESTLIDFYVPIESEQDYYNEKFRKFVEMLNNEMHLEKLNL